VPNKRIVQAWRVKIWPEGLYSIVSFELQPDEQRTPVVLTHDGFPPDMPEHLNGEATDGGWQQHWEPLRKYLS